jgi:hypothetical protein
MRLDVLSKSEIVVCLPGHGVGGYCWQIAELTQDRESDSPCTIELLSSPDVPHDIIGGGTSARFYIVGAPDVVYTVTFACIRAWNGEESQRLKIELTFGS